MMATERDEGLVRVAADGVTLEGNLLAPKGATGVVLFAHGSGSSRFSSRNRYVAEELRNGGLATLLIVGGDDVPVIGMNQEAYDQMSCERRMEIIPGASHLFEEPGTLERVAELARDWFVRWLRAQ